MRIELRKRVEMSSLWGILEAALAVAFALPAMAGGNSLQVDAITPASGPFHGGTPIELTGNFSVTFNSGPQTASFEVYFTAGDTANPASDVQAFVTASDSDSVQAITPPVDAPGTFNVYVRATNDVESVVSNLQPFLFLATNETPEQAVARTLLDSFLVADTSGDNRLSEEEARAIFSSLTSEQFTSLDTNRDSFLSADELTLQDGRGDSCQEQIGQFLDNFSIFGFLAFILSFFDTIRRGLFGLFIPA